MGQSAAVRHGVPGVHGKIEKSHLDLVGIGPGRRQIVGDVELELNPRARRAGDESGHAVDERRDIDRVRLQRLPAGEREQALHERFGALRRLKGALDQPLLAVAADAPALEQVEAADDGRQQVVEVVRHAAGELAHRLELLGLAELVMGSLELGSPLCHPLLKCFVQLAKALLRVSFVCDVGIDGDRGNYLPIDHDRCCRAAHHTFFTALAMANAHLLHNVLASERAREGLILELG